MNNREKILETALTLFNDQGSQAVTTNHIAKAAGVSPGNLYYHFKNKKVIILHLFGEMACCYDQVVPDGDTPPIPSFEAMDTMFKQISETEWKYRFLGRELVSLMDQDPELKTAFLAKQKEQLMMIEASIVGMIALGLTRPIPEKAIKQITQIIWLICIFWNPYLALSGEPVTQERMAESMEMVKLLIEPYIISPQ